MRQPLPTRHAMTSQALFGIRLADLFPPVGQTQCTVYRRRRLGSRSGLSSRSQWSTGVWVVIHAGGDVHPHCDQQCAQCEKLICRLWYVLSVILHIFCCEEFARYAAKGTRNRVSDMSTQCCCQRARSKWRCSCSPSGAPCDDLDRMSGLALRPSSEPRAAQWI